MPTVFPNWRLFPAHAGVILRAEICVVTKMNFSPHTLFPARAGVIPRPRRRAEQGTPFPRTRGGDPKLMQLVKTALSFSPHMRGTEAVSSVNGKTHGAICTVGFRILSSKPAQRPRYSLVTDAAAACFCTRSMPQSSRSLAATFGPLYSLVSSNGRNASCPSAVT